MIWRRAILQTFDPQTRWFAAARSTLAVAQLIPVVASTNQALFWRPTAGTGPISCDGVNSVSLFCVAAGHIALGRVITVFVLCTVVIGVCPALTCLPHWYVSLSLGLSVTLPDGGLAFSRIITLMLVPVLLGDRRLWAWQVPSTPLSSGWAGAGTAAFLLARLQVTLIYANAALGKALQRPWRDGRVMQTLLVDPLYGPPHSVEQALRPLVSSAAASIGIAWAVILLELAIAVFLWFPGRLQRLSLALTACLHIPIAVFIGLFSFSLTMISVVALVMSAPSMMRSTAKDEVPIPESIATDAGPLPVR